MKKKKPKYISLYIFFKQPTARRLQKPILCKTEKKSHTIQK